MRSQQSANCADARLDPPETEPEPPSNAFSKKEEDIMANAGHNRSIIADFHGTVITIVWL